MVTSRGWALLLIALLVGCTSTRVVRLDTGQGPPREYVPRTSDRSVAIDAEMLSKALLTPGSTLRRLVTKDRE